MGRRFRLACSRLIALMGYASGLTAQQYCMSGTVTTAPGNTFQVGDNIAVTVNIKPANVSCTTTTPLAGETQTGCTTTSPFTVDITSGGRHWTNAPPNTGGGTFSATGFSYPSYMVNNTLITLVEASELSPFPSSPGSDSVLAVAFSLTYSAANLVAGGILTAALPSPADVQAASATGSYVYFAVTNASYSSYSISYTGQDCALPPVTILDPVPIGGYKGLLNGPTIIPTRVALAVQGAARTVQGTAADGIAQVVFQAPTFAVGDMVTTTLFSDCADPLTPSTCSLSLSSDDNGGFFTIGTPVTSADQLNNTGNDNPADPDTVSTFFAYRAPVDFVRSSSPDADSGLASRTVYIQFSYSSA